MSSAHRPTWDPAKGRADTAAHTRIVGSRQLPSQTKLKFRQPGQGGNIPVGTALARDDWRRRDLKHELEEAEKEARRKKRKEEGGVDDEAEAPLAIGSAGAADDEEAKRRRLLQQAAELDKDEESSDDEESARGAKAGNGEGKATGSDSDSDSDSDDSDDDEDETAALLRELEKIKRERAEEKARQEQERSEAEQSNREDEIALGNPLLNLENAMKGSSAAASRSGAPSASDFGVKRRWDDDVIFKNQAVGNDGGDKSGFINDLARSEFHKRFMYRYIK